MTQLRKEFNLPPPLMLLKLPYEREVSNAEMETTTPIRQESKERRVRCFFHIEEKLLALRWSRDLHAEPRHTDLVPATSNRNNLLEEWSCPLLLLLMPESQHSKRPCLEALQLLQGPHRVQPGCWDSRTKTMRAKEPEVLPTLG